MTHSEHVNPSFTSADLQKGEHCFVRLLHLLRKQADMGGGGGSQKKDQIKTEQNCAEKGSATVWPELTSGQLYCWFLFPTEKL